MYGLDMINTSVLGALGCDMNTFLRYFPAAETMYSLLVALAIGLILLGWVWNLFKNYGLGLGVDAEDPVKLTAKAILFIVLAYYADEIVNIALTIGGTPYAWILSSELPSLDFASFNSVLLTIIGVCANGGVALIVLILTLILAWNYIKLMPEDIEPQENKKVVQECVGVTCTKLSSPWTVYLSTLIAAHYCCRPYRSSVHGSKVSEIGFIGMEDDFKLCKLAFLYAYDCISSRCRQIRTQKEYPAKTLREMCNSYGWGFCRGLSAAFQKQEAEHQEWGLVMVVPQAVEDAVSKMKRSSYKISSTSSMNRQYAAMGYADGQEFDMRRRLEPSA